MISIFHPSSLFCSSEEWKNPEFQDSYIENLLSHNQQIKDLKIDIAMSDEFFAYFWENNPWNCCDGPTRKWMNIILYKMQERFFMFNSPPDNICQIDPSIKNDLSEEVIRLWLILIHRLLFNKMQTLVVIGHNIESELDSINVFCDCDNGNTFDCYPIIKKNVDWYAKIEYMEKCPEQLDGWEDDFLLVIKMCYEQEFDFREFKRKLETIEFSSDFKKQFLELSNSKRKRIIKSITKLLTLNHIEAANDNGLREEIIKGEFRIRITQGERIHYLERDGRTIFLKYYSSSKHDEYKRKK
ncbi:MAG: hypothetical protein GQ533_14145 [Methanosarcinaceae archaeon]|nr:hypothetical protein [Methanosarcinaceae archaeon]